MIFFIALSLSFLMIPSYSFAKTYAYFVGSKGKIAKIDTETNAITQINLKIPTDTSLNSILHADTINNYLYVTHCIRLGNCKVGIYGLKTLDFIKELPLESSAGEAIEMLIYPDGSKFLVQYFDPGDEEEEGGYATDLYDAKTLTRINNLETIFAMKRVMFSSDSKKIYSIIGGDEPKVDIIDSTTFQVLESRDLIQIKKPNIFSTGIKNFGSGKILIFENLQAAKGLSRKLDLYVYDIETQAVSPKIATGLQGDATLTAGGTRIIFDENQDIRGKENTLRGFKSLGRIHIYDVATGNKIAFISFQPKGKGKIRGIRPDGSKLYYQSEGDTKDTSLITIIDINNRSVITSFTLPFKVLFMTFFEE